jgi:hypothetical protein
MAILVIRNLKLLPRHAVLLLRHPILLLGHVVLLLRYELPLRSKILLLRLMVLNLPLLMDIGITAVIGSRLPVIHLVSNHPASDSTDETAGNNTSCGFIVLVPNHTADDPPYDGTSASTEGPEVLSFE